MDRRSDGHGARPLGSDRARSDGCWRRARPAAHASGSEAVAALATAGRQDRAAGAGAHPQAEAVGLVPTAVVRLERALAQRIHSTRGAGLTVRSPGRAGRDVASWGQLAPLAHATTRGWTVMDMRHRSTPVSTCQRYALGDRQGQFGELRPSAAHRETATSAVRPAPRRPGTRRVSGATRRSLGARSLWTTVDPQARKLLASRVPGNPNHRLAAQANHRDAQRSRGVRARQVRTQWTKQTGTGVG